MEARSDIIHGVVRCDRVGIRFHRRNRIALAALCLAILMGGLSTCWSSLQAAEPADAPASGQANKPVAETQTEKPLPTIGDLTQQRQQTVERQEIEKFLERLSQIRQAQDGWEYGKLFEMRRLMKELGDQGAFDGAGFSEVLIRWATLQLQLRFGSIYQLERNEATVNSYHLGQLHFSPDGKEVQAFVLFGSEAEESWWVRLWLIKHEGQWLLFDHQLLKSGQRFTTSLAELGSINNPEKESWRRAKQLVDLAWTSLSYGYGDENAIQANLQAAARFPMHPETNLRRMMYEFKLAVDNPTQETAQQVLLASLLKVDRVIERQPYLLYLQARMAESHGEDERLVTAGKTFIDYIGPDEEICRGMGTALLNLKRKEEAAEISRLGLSINPSSYECLIRLASALPPEKAQEVGEYFSRFERQEGYFEAIAMSLSSSDCSDALMAVIKAYRANNNEDPDADYYEAKAWLSKNEPARAAKLLKAAIPRVQDEDERVHFKNAYFEAIIAAKQLAEVYAESTNQLADFKALAEMLTSNYAVQEDALHELTALHRKHHPRDPWLYFYLSTLAEEKEDFDEANEVLATGMRFATDAETLDVLRMQRVKVLYQANKVLEAYRTIPPRRKTFSELANHMRDDEKPELLEQLVALHREQDRRDPNLAVWEAEVFWQKKDYAASAKTLIAARNQFQEADLSLSDFEDRLIRSLIRAERFEEAENIALGIKERDDDAWYMLMVYAVWQDELSAMEMAKECSENGYYLTDEFYGDEDIGPAIKKPAFAKFRKKYPPPKSEE